MNKISPNLCFSTKIFPTVEHIAEFCASEMKGPKVALSGGSTFKALFKSWKEKAELAKLEYFPVDERRVPFEDPANNWGVAAKEFLIPISAQSQVEHQAESGRQYEQLLRTAFGGDPVFDELYLGMGDDGHTASLFPGGPELLDKESWVLESVSPKAPANRVSLGLRALWASRKLWLIATGSAKASMVKRLLEGDESLPATLALKGHREPLVLLDEDAAALLKD